MRFVSRFSRARVRTASVPARPHVQTGPRQGGYPLSAPSNFGAWSYFRCCSCPQGVDLKGARRVARREQNLRRRRYSFDDASMGSSRSCLDFLLAPQDIFASAHGIFCRQLATPGPPLEPHRALPKRLEPPNWHFFGRSRGHGAHDNDSTWPRAREKRETKRTTGLQLLHPRARGAFCFAVLARGCVCGDRGGCSVCTAGGGLCRILGKAWVFALGPKV